MNIIKRVDYILCILLFTVPGIGAQAAIKCWTNDQGNRECGSVVPPKYAQQEYQEINEQGRIVEEYERAKTDAELEEERRLAELEQEKQKQAEAQAKLDRILLDTFSTVEDIETTRDDKLAAIDTSVALAKRRTGKLQLDLDDHIKLAADAERSGKKPGEDLLQDIESLKRQIKNNEEFIAEKTLEKEMVREAYADDIARFLLLRGEDR